ncbi:hypothetical protein [Pseudosulfitobacter pseudonitzschiae]|uniref:hypothetical protein n=1 Tax=Pseudosulfitobacter pseudonitzschiae TaxID=1402135 RepID=UPI003B7AAADD
MNGARFFILTSTFLAAPALASAQASLESYARNLSATVSAVHTGDLDQDGVPEAIVAYGDDCNRIGCLFSVVEDFGDGSFAVVANQYGQDPELIHDGSMINASGAYWIWNGAALLPYGSALTEYNAQTGSLNDVEAIMAIEPWRRGLTRFDIKAHELDLIDDERLERVVRITDSKHASGRSLPFYIFDADGNLLDHDVALDAPVISPRSDRKAVQYSFTHGNGFMVKMIE